MNYLCRAGAYLNSVTATVNSICGMVLSDKLQVNVEMQYKISVTLIELEQAIADFIDSKGLDSELPQAVSISKRKLISTLKLENDTLKEEVNFL